MGCVDKQLLAALICPGICSILEYMTVIAVTQLGLRHISSEASPQTDELCFYSLKCLK